MAHFELHVCRNGNWNRLETFEDRDAAMSAAIRIEHDRSQSGVKIIKEVFNETSKAFEAKLIHKWSNEGEKKARDRETDQNLERQRQQRRMIRERARSNKVGFTMWNVQNTWDSRLFLGANYRALGEPTKERHVSQL